MKAQVLVKLKQGISDPEGIAIGQALGTMHYDKVKAVRVGKVFDLEIDETDPERAREALEKICSDVLSNPTIEQFEFKLLDEAKT